jgi:hypothetical protein
VHVRLSAVGNDPCGTLRVPGRPVNVDAVSLSTLKEQGMAEQPKSQESGKNTTTTTTTDEPQKIGPGPGAPPADGTEK